MYDQPGYSVEVAFCDVCRDEVLSAMSFVGQTADDVYRAVECLTFQIVEQTLRELVASGDVRRRGELYSVKPTAARRGPEHVIRAMDWNREAVEL